MAAALNEAGTLVTILNRNRRLMENQLDEISADILEEAVLERNIRIRHCDEITGLQLVGDQLLVTLRSGSTEKFDELVCALGTIPNTSLARQAGLSVNRGVKVNTSLQTSDPDIYAIGEIAELEDKSWGITAAADHQAEILADLIYGYADRSFTGYVSMNILKFPGIKLSSMGLTKAPDDSYEEIILSDRKRRYYKKCIVRNDRLVGAILMGDNSEFSEFRRLVLNGTELGDKRNTLLRSGAAADPPRGKLVCSCNSVGEENLLDLIRSGVDQLAPLMERSCAGAGCGSCKTELSGLLRKYSVPKV